MDDERGKLVRDIYNDADIWYKGGKLNNIADLLFTTSTVLASLAATVLSGTDRVEAVVVATVAALPAALATIQRVVNFRGRSLWYFRAGAHMRALGYETEWAKAPDLEKLARKRGSLEKRLEAEWAEHIFGASTSESPLGSTRSESNEAKQVPPADGKKSTDP